MKKRILIALGVLVLAAGIGAGGWYYYTHHAGSAGGSDIVYVTVGFEYNINEIDAFDSCGYSCSVLCVSWIENGKLGTYNILLEVR